MAKEKESNIFEEDTFKEYIAKFSEFTKAYSESIKASLEKNEEVSSMSPYNEMPEIMGEMFSKFMADPEKLYNQQIELYTDYVKVWNNAWGRYIGEEENPLFLSDPKDRRFKDTTWNQDVMFDFTKQSYLLTNQWLRKVVSDLDGVDKKTLEKFDFYTRQFTDAMAPSNFAFTNPEVIRETIKTKGENLTNGFNNFLEDLENSKQFLQIKTTDKHHFQLGKDIAATPGKVIYKNDLIELIQYNPVHKNTYQTPLLIMPAWINKYYILDLSEKNSFVKWLVDQGYTVFMISWVNPDKKHAQKKFDNYMLEGPIAALNAIEKATGEKEVNVMGYCLGGTLLSATLSYMKSKKDKRIKSATFLTTMVDFSYVGDMAIFINEEQIEKLDKQMQETGFLDGTDMAAIFSVIRANDLIWSFVVNNYLMGRTPLPFDILYWNADATRLPADTHSFYLRKMYLENILKKPGGITLDGVPIDVTTVDTPSYILSAEEDHIAPWKTTYETTNLFKGETKFVLAGSGHVAGVVNPPAKKKYGYWENSTDIVSADEWRAGATQSEGSWWLNWHEWNKKFSGKKIPAIKPGSGKLKPLENAPGSYIKVKSV